MRNVWSVGTVLPVGSAQLKMTLDTLEKSKQRCLIIVKTGFILMH